MGTREPGLLPDAVFSTAIVFKALIHWIYLVMMANTWNSYWKGRRGKKKASREVKSWILLFEKYTLKKAYLCQIFNGFDGVSVIYFAFSLFRFLWKVSYWSPSWSTSRTTTKNSYKKQGHNHSLFYWRTSLCIYKLAVHVKILTHQ